MIERTNEMHKRVDHYGFPLRGSKQIDSIYIVDDMGNTATIPKISLNGVKRKEWANTIIASWQNNEDPDSRIMFFSTGNNPRVSALRIIYEVYPIIESVGIRPRFLLKEVEKGKIAVVVEFQNKDSI